MEGSPPGIGALLQSVDGSWEARLAEIGAVAGLIVAIVLLAVLVARRLESVLRLDSHEYAVEMAAGEALGRLLELLRLRGLDARKAGDRILVSDVVRVVLLARDTGDGSRILYYAEPETLLVAAVVVLLAVNIVLGLAVAAILYLKYSDTRRLVRAALSEPGASQVYQRASRLPQRLAASPAAVLASCWPWAPPYGLQSVW
ncbi:hypothetical protein [Pyrodictium abyssi]|uniref:Uncharacterized protein n=1 Tax=Pyrodictium abyssi TaxID=54256 RepID=A0ABM8IVV5_9CREN|nr:hypothetical protein PABY_12500 [Pyrodictium abyssi]